VLTAMPRFGAIARENNIVVVEIGPEHTKYGIHKALLTTHSEYFRKELQKCWKEGEECKVVIDDVEPAVFDIIVHWLYTEEMTDGKHTWLGLGLLRTYGTNGKFYEWYYDVKEAMLLFKTYVLADRLGMLRLRNILNNMFTDALVLFDPHLEVIIYAFNNIPSGRPVLRLLVDSHCRFYTGLSSATFDEDKMDIALEPHLPADFLTRVVRRYAYLRDQQALEKGLNARDYYEGIEDEESD
jgi:hypothetical protein